jgi:hypothetical protein
MENTSVAPGNHTLSESFSFSGLIGSPSAPLPSTVRNPNKAVCTIDAETSKVGLSWRIYKLK